MAPPQTARDKGQQPELPEEAFWERYSPHHEFPLSTITTVGVLGLAAGLAAVAAILVGLARHDERSRPVPMDVAEIAGGGGTDGPAPLGAGLNPQGQQAKAENVTPAKQIKPEVAKILPKTPELKAPPQLAKIDIKQPPETKQDNASESAALEQLVTEAQQQVKKDLERERKAAEAKKVGQAGPTGVKNPGKGGGRGGQEGSGEGQKSGPGFGDSDTGVLRTKRERRELRWRIDFSGSGQEHLAKLRALGITLALPTGTPGQYWVMDLTSKRPTGKITNLNQQWNKIKWFNTSPLSLRELARVLGLRSVPPVAVIFLPPAMEQEMIQLEHDYKGLEEHQIELTEFEIQRRADGSFGPVVVSQKQRRS